jgi:hypothetical protein
LGQGFDWSGTGKRKENQAQGFQFMQRFTELSQ